LFLHSSPSWSPKMLPASPASPLLPSSPPPLPLPWCHCPHRLMGVIWQTWPFQQASLLIYT
jgi:hypothetical protein